MRSSFWTLCVYEFKKTLPSVRRGEKKDLFANLISIAVTLSMAVAFVFFLNIIAENYVEIKVNKVRDPLARGAELLNLFYTAIIISLSAVCLERIRKILSHSKEKEIFLRLPVKPETIFLSKMTVLMLETYVMSLLLIIPSNIVIYLVLRPGFMYWVYSLIVWLLLPMIPMFVASALIIPYIRLIDEVTQSYSFLFCVVTTLLIGAFWVYSKLLSVIQALLETGSIRFLFNADFINFVQKLRKITYPANLFTEITLGIDVLVPLITVIVIVIAAFIAVYAITKDLFYSTLYKNDVRQLGVTVNKKPRRLSPAVALIKKEFITVFRDPGHMFSYFSIATAMPVMVYCCYTLFESLLINAIGVSMNFSLALLIVLVFGVLTNTFCATNVTRDGLSALVFKMFPVKPSRIMLSKVIFCMTVSSLSAILSSALLVYSTSLELFDGVVVAALGVVFSTAQIFVATRLDLNNARVSSGPAEAERAANKTIAKVVFIGLMLSTLAGVFSVLCSMMSSMVGAEYGNILSYALPAVISLGYLLAAMIYYRRHIEKSFYNLVA